MASYLKASIQRSYAESFLAELERNENQYFFFIGKGTPWTVDTSPDTYVDTVQSEYQALNDAIGYKKLNPQNIIFALSRHEWVSGTVYDQYSDSVAQFDDAAPSNFYVVTEDNNIYKCLYNNGGSESTVSPSGVSTVPFTLSDGYTWKYISTVKEGDLPYELVDYIPVDFATTSTDTETQNQYNTQITAINSSITRIDLTTGATAGVYPNTIIATSGAIALQIGDYDRSTNKVTISDSVSVAKIRNSSITVSNYVGYMMRVNFSGENPSEIGNYAIITGVDNTADNGNSVVFTLQNDVVNFTVTPSGGGYLSSVEILPYIKIVGNGTGAYAVPVMNSNNNITAVTVADGGRDYSAAIAEVASYKTPSTNHPVLTPVISPKGGHGSNILKELNVKDILIIVEITGEDSEKFIGGGSYRQFGLVKNPVLSDGTGRIAGADDLYYRDCTLISTASAPLTTDFDGSDSNMIIGTESYAAAKVVDIKSTNDSKITLRTLNSTGRFITRQDRINDYLISLTSDPVVDFQLGETVTQRIPAGTDFGSGISFGYDLVVSGKVLSYSGNDVGVRLISNGNFVSSSGITFVGLISGATGFISSVSPSYGEYLWVTKTTNGSPSFASTPTYTPYKMFETGKAYFNQNNTPSYCGLHILELSSSVNGATGGMDTTSSALTQNSFSNGDSVYQGVTGTYGHYATGKVYYWDFVNSSYGKLYLTSVVGTFKSVAVDGLTGSTLGAYIVSSVVEPEIDRTSGEILYIDNVRPIQRTTAQEEEFRLRLGF